MQAALKKVFGGLNISWPVIVIWAVVAGIYTGLMARAPYVQDTSLTDICATFESWVLFAAIIVTNTKTPWESALKCFVFFLISQPLVYLVQVPFAGWSIMGYYKNWIIWTIATLPLGFAGHYITKNNVVAVIVMAAGSAFLAFHAATFLHEALTNPPWHILSFLFCVALILAMIFGCFEPGVFRKVSLGLAAAFLAFAIFFAINPRIDITYNLAYFDDEIEITPDCQISSANEKIATTEIVELYEGNYSATIHFVGFGKTEISFVDADGIDHRYEVSCEQGNKSNYDIEVKPLE